MTQAPTLETERLILRAFRREDFDAIFEMNSDAERTKFMGGPTNIRSTAWEKFLRGPAMWQLLGYGMWIVERRADGAVLGQVGYADFMRDIDPPLPDVPEMAWVLGRIAAGPDGRGVGYGSEALTAALAWGDANLVADCFQCIILPDNEPSLRLAHRHDFKEKRRAIHKEEPTVILERQRLVV